MSVTVQQMMASDPSLIRVEGDEGRVCDRVAPLDQVKPGALTFIGLKATPDMIAAATLDGSVVICGEAQAAQIASVPNVTRIVAENARLAFVRAVKTFFAPARPTPGVHPTAVVADDAWIDPTAHVGPGVVVGAGSRIGAGTVIHPNVVIYDKVVIGERVIVHAGTVIGAEGFGYERNDAGELEAFVHVGGVTIHDEAEIGSNTSIDRGTLGDTIIGRRARIDNQVHIAHNVIVGEDAAVVAQSMVGGSVSIGTRAWLAPASVVINKGSIGDRAFVGLGAVVVKAVPDGQTVMGSPAVPDHEFKAVRKALKTLIAE